MSDDTFPVDLGGVHWDLPHLPFRLVKRIQPAVAAVSRQFPTALDAQRALVNLDEAALDAIAGVVFSAIGYVDATRSKDDFYELPFASGDLMAALPSVLSACGMTIVARDEADAQKK
jgi:hypothetical protein